MVIFYDENGAPYESKRPEVVSNFMAAKYVKDDKSNSELFYVAIKDSVPFNKNYIDVRHKKQELWKFKNVNEDLFDSYLRFLRTGNDIAYNRVRREM